MLHSATDSHVAFEANIVPVQIGGGAPLTRQEALRIIVDGKIKAGLDPEAPKTKEALHGISTKMAILVAEEWLKLSCTTKDSPISS